jgi:hypothetical protein
VKTPTPRRLLRYVTRGLRLGRYLAHPGDGRPQPQIPARVLLWALVLGRLLREPSFHGVEPLVRSSACRALGVYQSFGDDTLSYFTERLDPARLRAALIDILRRAKRVAIDGTTAGRSSSPGCGLCRPQRNAKKEVIGYAHQQATISVVGTGLSLPFDAEPYGPGGSEYAAGQRLLARAVSQLGARFADYLVVDSAYASAPFLHAAGRVGVHVVARLKTPNDFVNRRASGDNTLV